MNNLRLKSILNKVLEKEGSVVADIACDHALLSIELAKSSKVKRIIASDINAQPLESGKLNAKRILREEHNKIEFVLSDGIQHINEGIDFCIVAGVGSKLAISIIDKPNIKHIENLIVQGNNNVIRLRESIPNLGFRIADEWLVEDSGIIYEVVHFEKGVQEKLTSKENLLGKYIDYTSPLFKKKWKERLNFFLSIREDKRSSLFNEWIKLIGEEINE